MWRRTLVTAALRAATRHGSGRLALVCSYHNGIHYPACFVGLLLFLDFLSFTPSRLGIVVLAKTVLGLCTVLASVESLLGAVFPLSHWR